TKAYFGFLYRIFRPFLISWLARGTQLAHSYGIKARIFRLIEQRLTDGPTVVQALPVAAANTVNLQSASGELHASTLWCSVSIRSQGLSSRPILGLIWAPQRHKLICSAWC